MTKIEQSRYRKNTDKVLMPNGNAKTGYDILSTVDAARRFIRLISGNQMDRLKWYSSVPPVKVSSAVPYLFAPVSLRLGLLKAQRISSEEMPVQRHQ